MLSPPESCRAQAAGFRELTKIFDRAYQGAGVIMQRGRLDERGPAALAFQNALRRGVEYTAQPDRAMQVLAEYAKELAETVLAARSVQAAEFVDSRLVDRLG